MQPSHKVIPHLVVSQGQKALDWYRDNLGATIHSVMPGPNNTIAHAAFTVGETDMFLSSMSGPESNMKAPDQLKATTFSMYAYVDDVDASYDKAIKAGAKSIMAPMDAFWGDRWANIVDPFGHNWQFGKHQEDVTPEKMQERLQQMMAKGGM